MENYRLTVDDTDNVMELRNYIISLEQLLSRCYDELQRHDTDATYNTNPVLMESIRTTIEVRNLFDGNK